jgi:hypothetical protein
MMKKAFILFLLFTLTVHAEIVSTNLSNGEIVSIPYGYSIGYYRKGITNNLSLPQGKQLIVHGINGSPLNIYFPKVFVRADHGSLGKVDLAIFGTGGISGWSGPILGPLEIEYGLDSSETFSNVGSGLTKSSCDFLMEIKSSQFETNEVASLVIPSTSVVVPSNATGDVDVLLEQSNDMITWTQCLPGTYNASTQKRFFRVRAVEK